LLRNIEEEENVIVTCTALVVFSVGATLAAVSRKRKHSTWVKHYIRDRQRYGAYSTLLPELASSDMSKWVQYVRMDVGTFEELIALVPRRLQNSGNITSRCKSN